MSSFRQEILKDLVQGFVMELFCSTEKGDPKNPFSMLRIDYRAMMLRYSFHSTWCQPRR